MNDPEVRVSYDVRDLLDRIDTRLASIDSKLDAKADLRIVLELQDELRKLKARMEERDAVEAAERSRNQATFTRREKVFGILIAAVAVLIQPLQRFLHF